MSVSTLFSLHVFFFLKFRLECIFNTGVVKE